MPKTKELMCDEAATVRGGPSRAAHYYRKLWIDERQRFSEFFCVAGCEVRLRAVGIYRKESSITMHFRTVKKAAHTESCGYMKRKRASESEPTGTGVQEPPGPPKVYVEESDDPPTERGPRGPNGTRSPMSPTRQGTLTAIAEAYLDLVDKHSADQQEGKGRRVDWESLNEEAKGLPLQLLEQSLTYYSAFRGTTLPHPSGQGHRIYHSLGRAFKNDAGDYYFYSRGRVKEAGKPGDVSAQLWIPRAVCDAAIAAGKHVRLLKALENSVADRSPLQWFCVGILVKEADDYKITVESLKRLRVFSQ